MDPRRDPLVEAVREAASAGAVEGRNLRACLEIERQIGSLARRRPIPLNIDGASAVIYSELGFTPLEGRGLFVLSRSVGALAHAAEESRSGKRNKGPIDRALLPTYTGVPPRHVAL